MYLILIIFSYHSLFSPFCFRGEGLKKSKVEISTNPFFPFYSLISSLANPDEPLFFFDYYFSLGLTDWIEVHYYNIPFLLFKENFNSGHFFHYLTIKTNISSNKNFSPFLSASFGRLFFWGTSEITSFSSGIRQKLNSHIYNISTGLLLAEEEIKMPFFHFAYSFKNKNIFLEGLISNIMEKYTNGVSFFLGLGFEKTIKRIHIMGGGIFSFSTHFSSYNFFIYPFLEVRFFIL